MVRSIRVHDAELELVCGAAVAWSGSLGGAVAVLLEEGAATPADVFFSQAGGALFQAGRLEQLPQGVLDTILARVRAEDGSWIGTSG